MTENKMKKYIEFYLDSLLYVRVTKENKKDLHCDFLVTHYALCSSNGEKYIKYYIDVNEMQEDPLKCPIIKGSVKWDGCMNYVYPDQENCMLHACGITSHKDIFEAFKKVYELADEMMPGNEQFLKERI